MADYRKLRERTRGLRVGEARVAHLPGVFLADRPA